MNVSRSRTAWRTVAALFVLSLALRAEPERLLEVRLLSPLSTSDASTWDVPIHAEIVRWLTGGPVTVPTHTLVHGRVIKAKPVGYGLLRERAALSIEFTEQETTDGEMTPLSASLVSIDNAREQVDRKGRIQGILAANNPLGIVRGVWYRPHPRMFLQGAGGMGTSGTVWAKMALGPVGAASLLAAKIIFTRLPDPEIVLPAGTEMILRVTSEDASTLAEELPAFTDPCLLSALAQFPTAIRKPNGELVPDVVNLALLGSEEVIRRSFLAAGWSEAEPLTRKSFGRAYKAWTQRTGYAEAPVSTLLYEGRAPDLVFQKSLNSIAKRHHIRLWRVVENGSEVWLGAASHDVTVTLDRKTFMLSHRIDLSLDAERQKVLSDLVFAQSAEEVSFAERAAPGVGSGQTDGRLAVVRLQSPADFAPIEQFSPGKVSGARRVVRRITLETRQYLFRENVYYLGYLSARRVIERHRNAQAAARIKDPDPVF